MDKKVLVVDDNKTSVQLVRDYLGSKGFQIIEAYDGQEGLRKAREEAPDLIILDVMMPIMDGISVLKELKRLSATSKIPVIMLTAKGTDEDVMKGYQQGAEYYITKPFSFKQLMLGINLMLGLE